MAVDEKQKSVLKGGEFLISGLQSPQFTFTPEDFNEDQKMFADMATEFVDKRVKPNLVKLDKQEPGLTEQLVEEAGALGIFGAAVPEEYGGMGVDINTESILCEILGGANSFSVTYAAHTGIGTLPILYYGTPEQKAKYLPKLASGEMKAAYCLTEPGSGSDALAARTKATLTEDGQHYIIEGQKMWITNAGFADLFTVFAKIDGEHFTGFLVEGTAENVRLGNEEDKLGIKGSSTRQVFFEKVKVPKENVLGEIGRGHLIAFNVLNVGRFKLGLLTAGGAKATINKAIKYANEREQFGRSIGKFGAIQYKLAEMATRLYVLDATNYRTSGMIKDMIDGLVEQGKNPVQAKLEAAQEYAIECAILKVLGSEILDYVVDETVQVHGGNGFSEEYSAARDYRDSRINRIFEGTNEINRLLSVSQLLKRAMKGQIDLMGPAQKVAGELMAIPSFGDDDGGLFVDEKKSVAQAKKALLLVAGAAVKKYMQKLSQEQQVVMNLADMLIEIYACESVILRTEKMVGVKGEAACEAQLDMMRVYISDTMERLYLYGKHAIAAFAEDDELKMMLLGVKRFTKYPIYNSTAARKRIATRLLEENEFCF